MSKPVVMTPEQWGKVLERIKQREKPSVYLSRTKMKDTLGFTVRDHREYVKDPNYIMPPDDYSNGIRFGVLGGRSELKRSDHTVRLDFYDDDQKLTMFLLKYGNGRD